MVANIVILLWFLIFYRIAFVIIILSKKRIAKRSCVNAHIGSRSSLERS